MMRLKTTVPAAATTAVTRRIVGLPPIFSAPHSYTSSPFSSRGNATDTEGPHPPDAAIVVQGPSLLTGTSTYRPSPSLFHLPGLRSLPFWTAPVDTRESDVTGGASKRRVAYGDPTVTRVLEVVEGALEDVRGEYLSAVVGQGTSTNPDADAVKKPLEPDYDVISRGGEHASDALHEGSWDWHSHVLSGVEQPRFREHCPKTAAMIDVLREDGLLFDSPFSFCFYSSLMGDSRIKPHVGPMNLI